MDKKILLFVMMFLISACASMSKEDCQGANWKLLGEEDGREGKSVSSFNNMSRQCLEHGVTANQSEWISGYKIGLESYCTFENGYEIGLKGQKYQKVCPSKSSKDFLQGYIEGKRNFDQKKQQEERQSQYAEEQQRQNQFRERILGNMRNQSCRTEYDCAIKDVCVRNKCSYTGKECTTDYQCEIKGSCNSNRCHF